METLGYFLDALQVLGTVPGILHLLLGTLAGLVSGAIPGMGGGTLMVMLLPITYKMDVVLAMALFLGISIGSVSGGCISSILLGIPGTSASIVTVWDGYEFTKQGDPVRPLSVAVVSNFLGTVPSVVVAFALCKVIGMWAVNLGPWEYAALCFCALAMVVGLSKGDALKGMIAVALAMLLASVGVDPINGSTRFTFGNIYLYNGFNIVNIMLGMFASKIVLLEFAKLSKIDASAHIKVRGFKFPGKDLLTHLGTVIRAWFIGAFIGFLPGLGGPAATVIAYANEKSMAKDRAEYGKGAISGVIAAETANNASVGGALIPMITLGIPGDATMVQLLAVLSIHGINAGPMLIKNNPEVVYMLFTAGIIAGVIALVLEVFGMPLFPALLRIPYHQLYPAVLVICFLGAYMTTGTLFGLAVTLGACLLGLAMDYLDVPVMPFIMGFILSGMLEKNIRQGLNYSLVGVAEFFTRPISCVCILLGVAVLAWNLLSPLIQAKKQKGKS